MAESLSCTVKREGREYIVTVSEDSKTTTVTHGSAMVTIRPRSGNYDVRLPNGWGNWAHSMEQAVNQAIGLCDTAKTQLTEDAAYDQMVGYVKDCLSQ